MTHDSTVTMDKLWPEDTCPVCGKRFLRKCSKEEWGWAYNKSKTQISNRTTLLCSAPCVREFARRHMAQNAAYVAGLRCFKVWWMYNYEWKDADEIAQIFGTSRESVRGMIDLVEDAYWQEAEWIADHPSGFVA